MVKIEESRYEISVHTSDPKVEFQRIRESLIDVTTSIVESDKLIKETDLRIAVATLIKFLEHLTV